MSGNFFAKYPASLGTINGLTGNVTFAAGTGLSLSIVGNTITYSASGGSSANLTLSNLTSPTSVNQDLIPVADNTQKLGSTLKAWADLSIVTLSIGGVTAIDVSSNYLYDGGAVLSVDWNNRFFHDNNNLLALNWNNRTLYANDGSTIMLDWHLPGEINASTNLITNVLNPLSGQDAATKSYVDAAASGTSSNTAFTLSSSAGVGTNSTVFQLFDKTDGLWIRAQGAIAYTGSGTDAAPLTILLPLGYELDQSRIAGSASGTDNIAALCGYMRWYDSGVGWKPGTCEAYDLTHIKFVYTAVLLGNFFATGDGLVYVIEVPVV